MARRRGSQPLNDEGMALFPPGALSIERSLGVHGWLTPVFELHCVGT